MYVFRYKMMSESSDGKISAELSKDQFSDCAELADSIVNFLVLKDEQKPIYVRNNKNQIVWYKLDDSGNPVETDRNDPDGIELKANMELNKLYDYFAADNSECVNEFIESMPTHDKIYIEVLHHALERVYADYNVWLQKNCQ